MRLRLLLLAVALVAVHGCQDVSVTEVDVASISVTPGTATLLPNQATTLSATPRDASGAALSNRAIAWRSDNAAVATVDASGRVQAHAAGTARIEASSGGIVGMALVTVNPAPLILLSRTAVDFGGVSGGNATPAQAIQVTNGGGGSLTGLRIEVDYASGQPGGWLDADLQGTSAPTNLTLRALPSALPAGSYAAEVRVLSSGATNSPRTLQVALVVAEAPPVIRVSPEALGFSTSEGQGAPPSQTVTVTNAGGGGLTNLSVTVSHSGGSPSGWLTAELDRTFAPAQVLLRVDPSGLSTGVFDATVQVASPDAPGGSATVQVRLRFGDPPPQIEVVPGTVQTTMEEGSTTARLLSVQVENAGTGNLGGLSSQVQYSDPSASGWLQANLRSTTAPAVLDLQFSSANRLPGSYGAQVVISSPDAINSSVTLDVLLVVRPRPSVATSTVSAAPEAIVADGTSSSEITVTLNDPRGDPVPFEDDSVQVFTTAGTLSGVTSLGGGRYRATLVSTTTVQTATVTARIRGETIQNAATVRFTAGAPAAAQSTVNASPTSVGPGASSTVTVQLRDAGGNPVSASGDAVFLTASLGTLIPASGTSTNGVFQSSFASTTAGTATITAYLGSDASAPQIGTATITVQAGGADAGQSTVSASPTTITAGAASTVTVQLRDAAGNPLAVSGDGIFLATNLGTLTPASGTSTNGVFQSSFASNTAGTAIITAYLGSDASAPQIGTAAITVQAGGADAGQSTVTASPTPVAPGANSTVTVQLRDAAGNPIATSGDDIFLATDLGGVAPNRGTTTNGVFTSTFSSATAGTATIRAYLGNNASGAQIGTATVTIEAATGGPDAGASTVSASPTTVQADSASTVTVQLRDAANNPIMASGDAVFLATTLGTLTPTSGTTTGGVFQSSFVSGTAGTATITAYLGSDASAPVIGTATVTIEAGEPDAGQSGLGTDATGDPEMPVGGALVIQVQLRDAGGNEVTQSGDPIFLTTNLGELEPVSGPTTAGRFESVFTSSEAGTATIAAYLGEDEGGQPIGTLSVTIEERTPDPGASIITSDQTHISRNGSANIRVELRDATGGPLTTSGTPIFLTTSRGQATPTSGTTTNGVFTSIFSSAQTGNTVITAYLGENAQAALIGTVEVVVQGSGGDETGEVIADTLAMTTDDSVTVRVALRDADGNLLTTSGTEISLVTSMGVLEPSTGATSDGVFEAIFRSSDIGVASISAFLGDPEVGELLDQIEITVTPGALSAAGSTLAAAPAEVDAGEPSGLTVQLRDAAGNALAIAGQGIVLATTGGELSATLGTTDANGRWTSTLLLSEAPGSATVSAWMVEGDERTLIGSVVVTTSSVTAVESGVDHE